MVDVWNRLADLFGNLIEKYAVDLDIEGIPDTLINTENKVKKREKE